MAIRFARIALGLAFLSAVGIRFGLWGSGGWSGFVEYTGEVCSFMPRSTIPLLAVAATCCELSFGLALVTGVMVRHAAIGAAGRLAMCGTAMAISNGVRDPLDYSVFSASACAVLLASADRRRVTTTRS